MSPISLLAILQYLVQWETLRHTGECRPVDKIEKRLDPTPVDVKEVLKRLLQVVRDRPNVVLGGMESIIPVCQRGLLVPSVATHW